MPNFGGTSPYTGLSPAAIKTAGYTAAPGEMVPGDTTTAGFTVTLPTNPTVGAQVGVYKTDSTANVLTILPAGTGTIDGDANAQCLTKNAGATVEHLGGDAWKTVSLYSAAGAAGYLRTSDAAGTFASKVATTDQTFSGSIVLGTNKQLRSPEALTAGYASSVGTCPQVFPIIDDNGTNGICSVTLGNKSTTNRFGEFAVGMVEAGIYSDTWAMASDPARNNTENFKLRHRGIDIYEVLPQDAGHGLASGFDANAFVFHKNPILNTAIGVILKAENAAGTAIDNLLRVSGSNLLTIGSTTTWTGIGLYAGTGDFTVNAAEKIVNQDATKVALKVLGQTGQSVGIFRVTTAAEAATLLDVNNAGNVYIAGDVKPDGFLTWQNVNVQTTVGAAGAASALPATPTKYLKVKDAAGTTFVVPCYAAV